MTENKNIIISGGGTGGHLFPAIAIRDQIVKNNPRFNVHFVGSIYGIEKNTLAQKGYRHTLLPVSGLMILLIRLLIDRDPWLPPKIKIVFNLSFNENFLKP